MPALDLNEPIQLDTGEYQFVQQSGNIIRLRDSITSDVIDMTVTELCRRATGFMPPRIVAPRDLEVATDKALNNANKLAPHIRELHTGLAPDASDPRPEYDPAVHTLEARIQSKIIELNKLGIKTSRTTLQRLLKEFEKAGAAGLLDRRALRQHEPLARLDLRIKDCLFTAIAGRTNKSTGTRSQLIAETEKEYLRRYGTAPTMPSRTSMYRYVQTLTAGTYTTESARTRRSLANRPQRTFAFSMATLPGEEVQIDSTKMDVLVRVGRNQSVRPVLTIAVDVRTRSILAATIRIDATKGVDQALLIAHCLTPPENRPDRTAYREALGRRFPNTTLLGPEERVALEAARPFVHPRRIQMDNGKDYAGTVFQAALQKFGIDATYSAPHTPTDKAIVERTFGSINTLFTQELPGYTGRSPEHRGYKVEDDDLLDVYMLYELFDDWVLNVWQNRAHSGLRDPWKPEIAYSPNQAIRAAAEVSSTLYLPLTGQDYLELLPTRFVCINADGVRIDNRKYDSVELHPYRNTLSSYPQKNGKWPVKVDPYNSFAVWVQLDDGKLIECALRNKEQFFTAHAEDMFADELNERETVAFSNAALNGAPIHVPLPAAPTTFTDDTSWDELDDTFDDFDPNADIY